MLFFIAAFEDGCSLSDIFFSVYSETYSFGLVGAVVELALMNFDFFDVFSSFINSVFASFRSAASSLLADLGGGRVLRNFYFDDSWTTVSIYLVSTSWTALI